MPDEADDAQGFESIMALQVKQRLEANQQHHRRPSSLTCEECGDAIPVARQALGGVTRCVHCQECHERHLG